MDLCFGQKYTLMSRLGGGGQDLNIRSSTMGIRERELRQLARNSSYSKGVLF